MVFSPRHPFQSEGTASNLTESRGCHSHDGRPPEGLKPEGPDSEPLNPTRMVRNDSPFVISIRLRAGSSASWFTLKKGSEPSGLGR